VDFCVFFFFTDLAWMRWHWFLCFVLDVVWIAVFFGRVGLDFCVCLLDGIDVCFFCFSVELALVSLFFVGWHRFLCLFLWIWC